MITVLCAFGIPVLWLWLVFLLRPDTYSPRYEPAELDDLMGIWYEVWRVERGEDPPPVLLAKFPGGTEGREAANQAKNNIETAGGILVDIREIVDSSTEEYSKGH